MDFLFCIGFNLIVAIFSPVDDCFLLGVIDVCDFVDSDGTGPSISCYDVIAFSTAGLDFSIAAVALRIVRGRLWRAILPVGGVL